MLFFLVFSALFYNLSELADGIAALTSAGSVAGTN
jgi:hypothetical protein